MTQGISVHIGLNRVDAVAYQGWSGPLAACEADAQDMQALAQLQQFQKCSLLLTRAATAAAVTAAVRSAARSLHAGDLFLLTYSGHGGQVDDTNGDEADRMDETWVCYDRQLIDDELYDLWSQFQAGVRIVVLSDSCHSGSVLRAIPAAPARRPRVRAMPSRVARAVQEAHATLYRRLQKTHRSSETSPVRASVILLSGCMDNQLSQDGERNGLFTGTLKKVWNGGKFPGHYRKLRDVIVSKMPPDQTPNYYVVGASNPEFEAQSPFTI